MKRRCFELGHVIIETRDISGRPYRRERSMLLEDAGLEPVNTVLSRWDLEWMMLNLKLDIQFNASKSWPWAIAFYETDFRLAGHVVSLRESKRDIGFSSCSLLGVRYSPEEHGIPPVSMLFINRKDALREPAEKSLFFRGAWNLLKDRDEQNNWLCLPESPKEAWLEETSKNDDGLFRELMEW